MAAAGSRIAAAQNSTNHIWGAGTEGADRKRAHTEGGPEAADTRGTGLPHTAVVAIAPAVHRV